jgi:hypothetical protein
LIPREGIRPLYRAALERADSFGESRSDPEDSFALLADYCSALLPLPPFEVWCEDFARHRAAHLDEADSLGGESREELVTVEVRAFEDEAGAPWYASLDLRRSGGAWRGSVAFHSERGSRAHRTGEIFVESDAATVRARFLEYGLPTLRAFLRSVRP